MPKYTFTVTRNITTSTRVTVEADDIGEAHAEALVLDLDDWELDDCSGGEAYIPDPSDYETGPVRYAVVKESESTCERKQIAQVETLGDPHVGFHKRYGTCVEYVTMTQGGNETDEDYRYRIGATT
jgi:hypothetical protein